MTAWLVAAVALLLMLVPCGVASLRGTAAGRVAGLQMAGIVLTILLMVLAEALQNPSFFDLPLALVLVSLSGALAFARYLERWM